MKIKNDLVKIKIGKKQYDFNNLILDTYLKKFAEMQLDKDNVRTLNIEMPLNYCLLKFDTPFENLSENTELHNQDFDIGTFSECESKQIISSQKVNVQYNYTFSRSLIDYSDGNLYNIDKYYGRKITAIGFNCSMYDDSQTVWKPKVLAVLDTSNYNLYLQENQELTITRKDIITTDALFYSNDTNKVPGPAHLAPFGVPEIIQNKEGYYMAAHGILYSIGLSSYTDYIDKEFIIGQDIEVEENETELNIKGLENYLVIDNSLFPSNEIYPSTGLYPIKTNYKYIILKYKVWQIVYSGPDDNVTETLTDTGYYYYQAIPIDKFGELDLKIKYERG